jgi:hypothetical protein
MRWRFHFSGGNILGLITKVISYSERHIDRADHRFWNGTDKSARPSLFRISSDS